MFGPGVRELAMLEGVGSLEFLSLQGRDSSQVWGLQGYQRMSLGVPRTMELQEKVDMKTTQILSQMLNTLNKQLNITPGDGFIRRGRKYSPQNQADNPMSVPMDEYEDGSKSRNRDPR